MLHPVRPTMPCAHVKTCFLPKHLQPHIKVSYICEAHQLGLCSPVLHGLLTLQQLGFLQVGLPGGVHDAFHVQVTEEFHPDW